MEDHRQPDLSHQPCRSAGLHEKSLLLIGAIPSRLHHGDLVELARKLCFVHTTTEETFSIWQLVDEGSITSMRYQCYEWSETMLEVVDMGVELDYER
uniref:Uncharacterized protein n=1 Tax=Oryza rufipogon TaxID=4529 RepID=A0A0E0P886_ORYRU